MVKCHVVDVHITPLEERQHTSHQNIKRIPNPVYSQERFAYHKRPFWHVLCLHRIGLPCCTFATIIITCMLQIILPTNYSVTYNFSTCRHYLAENHLSFPFAPRWDRHSYLSKRATLDPLYLWVIKAISKRRCWGVKRLR